MVLEVGMDGGEKEQGEKQNRQRRKEATNPMHLALAPLVSYGVQPDDEQDRSDTESDREQREQVVAHALRNEPLVNPHMPEWMGGTGADRDECE